LGALDGDFDSLPNTRSLCRRNRRESLVLCLLAGLTAFWFVLQTLVVEEDLLPGSPDKILSTVNTFYWAILEFHLGFTPLTVRSYFHLCL
jgi:hypothetical protein